MREEERGDGRREGREGGKGGKGGKGGEGKREGGREGGIMTGGLCMDYLCQGSISNIRSRCGVTIDNHKLALCNSKSSRISLLTNITILTPH